MNGWRRRWRSLLTGSRDRSTTLGLGDTSPREPAADVPVDAGAPPSASTEEPPAATDDAAAPAEAATSAEEAVGRGVGPPEAAAEGPTDIAAAGAPTTAPDAAAVEPAAEQALVAAAAVEGPAAASPVVETQGEAADAFRSTEPAVESATVLEATAAAEAAEEPAAEPAKPEDGAAEAASAAGEPLPSASELEAQAEQLRRLEAELLEERASRRRLEDEVARLADKDPLTGLASAHRFADRLGVAVVHALRQKHKLAIVQLGIDRFDAAHNGSGTSPGDELLRSVALALEGTLRQGDTIARLGAEPVFTILLPGVKHDDDVTVIADKLRLALRSPFSVAGSDLLVTASIGMALFPDDGSDAESLLHNATLAMERAREKGGDAWDVHAPESRARAAQRQARETALRRALVRGGLELYWQPVVTCDTRTIVGVESLLRWRGHDRPPPASDLVSLSEVSGLAVPLGQWMLRAACRQAGHWRGLGYDQLVVGVGISARQLAHAAFVKLVRRELAEAALPAAALELAIPASELAGAPTVALERLAEIRKMGIRVALDAFGTADSRLSDPHRYALDTLRIDESVVRDAVASGDRAAVIRACVALARARRLRVVAAGADTEGHRSLLVRLRCDHMRGRLCGVPAPAAEIEDALRASRAAPGTSDGPAPGRRLL